MSIVPINIGGQANDGNGQTLRSGGALINANFAELDTRTATAQETAEQGVTAAAAAQAKADAAIPSSALGSTVAQLVAGTVPASQLPSFVDDVLEFATLANFPAAGETGKIYIAINGGDSPSNPTRQYRWSGTAYVVIPSSPGSTDQVPEGSTNLYHTAARVRAVVLTGLGALTNSAIAATDSILQALAKLQGQINEKLGKTEKAADATLFDGQLPAFYTNRAVWGSISGLIANQLDLIALADSIVESGANANGSFVKFRDGTLICFCSASFPSVAVTSAAGNVFISAALARNTWPIPFVGAAPRVTYSSYTSSGVGHTSRGDAGNITQTPLMYVVEYISASRSVGIDYVGYGRWKA